MNHPIVKKLVLKDLQINFLPLLGLSFGLPALALVCAVWGGTNWRYVGAILMVNSLIYLSFFVPIGSILGEKKPFVFSLPVSPLEYTASKLIFGLLVFFVPWAVYIMALPQVISAHPMMPTGALIPAVILLTIMLLSFLVNILVALVFENQAGTVGAGLAVVPVVFAFMPLMSYVPRRLIENWSSSVVVWDPEAVAGIATLALLCVLTVALTFVLQKRKRSFV